MKFKAAMRILLILACIGTAVAVSKFGIGENRDYKYTQIRQGLDLKGGVSVLYEAKEKELDKEQVENLKQFVNEEKEVDLKDMYTKLIGDSEKASNMLETEEKLNENLKDELHKLSLTLVESSLTTKEIDNKIQSFLQNVSISLNEELEKEALNEELTNLKVGLEYLAGEETREEMRSAVTVIRNRVDSKGFTEADVSIQGKNRLLVEVPGIKNPEDALEMIGKTGKLAFVDPEGKVVMTGEDVETAYKANITNKVGGTETVVQLKLNADGQRKFAVATGNLIGKPIAIVLDEEVISAPVVRAKITRGVATISNNSKEFQQSGAEELANLIKSGAIPFELETVEMSGIGAKLGQDALNTGIKAGIVGISLVLLYMILMYRLPGILSAVALVGYMALLLVIFAGLKITLTLPGIAGVILSVGMAVDANVIIFTRIKEEINMGKKIRTSVRTGFEKALSAIVDGNMTTLIAAAVLWSAGTGPIKGFAQTLGIGIMVSMFTSLVVTKLLLKQCVELGIDWPFLYGAKRGEK